MLTWIKIALRNLIKQKRRSAFTILAIALGFGGVTVFGGFTRYMFQGLREGYVYGAGNGNLTAFKRGYRDKGSLDPARYLLTPAETDAVREICRTHPRFKSATDSTLPIVTPQLHFTGLISNGEVSTIFVAIGRVPSDSAAMAKRATSLRDIAQKTPTDSATQLLKDDDISGVVVSSGLARKLNLQAGADAVMMAPTVDGQMNALNAKVLSLADAADEVLSDRLVVVNLKYAQSLYDTQGADAISILLDDAVDLTQAKRDLDQLIAARGLDIEVCTWKELNASYTKVANMFNVIFSFLFVIVFVIVVLSIINTVSMAVLERTRETGTLRSLGLKRRGIVVMFAVESAILSLFGSLGGLLLDFATGAAVRWLEPTWTPPIMSSPVRLQVYIVPQHIAMAFACLMLLAVISAILPARRAVRMSIVDALGHV